MEKIKMVKILIEIEDTRYIERGKKINETEMIKNGCEVITEPEFIENIERDVDRKIITIGNLKFKQIK